jgi:hypothetical protein
LPYCCRLIGLLQLLALLVFGVMWPAVLDYCVFLLDCSWGDVAAGKAPHHMVFVEQSELAVLQATCAANRAATSRVASLIATAVIVMITQQLHSEVAEPLQGHRSVASGTALSVAAHMKSKPLCGCPDECARRLHRHAAPSPHALLSSRVHPLGWHGAADGEFAAVLQNHTARTQHTSGVLLALHVNPSCSCSNSAAATEIAQQFSSDSFIWYWLPNSRLSKQCAVST